MSEQYTPTTNKVREAYATRMAPLWDDWRRKDFDRWLDQVRREAKIAALQPFLEMSEEMGQAIAFDVLTTPHGEAEYPVSYFREQLDKAIGQAEDQLEQEGKNDGN